jgi:hypothetical protein
MNLLTRLTAATLTTAAIAIPTTAMADSPNAGGAVTRSTDVQVTAHFMTIDATGCIRNDLFIHGVAGSPGAIDAGVQSYNQCTNTLLLLTGGTSYNSTVQADEQLQSGLASGTIVTYDRSTGNALPVTVDLGFVGYGGLTTGALAPGQAPSGSTGFHVTTPFVNVTLNGVTSFRAATMMGTITIPGYSFPTTSAQADFTGLSAGSSNFIITFKG